MYVCACVCVYVCMYVCVCVCTFVLVLSKGVENWNDKRCFCHLAYVWVALTLHYWPLSCVHGLLIRALARTARDLSVIIRAFICCTLWRYLMTITSYWYLLLVKLNLSSYFATIPEIGWNTITGSSSWIGYTLIDMGQHALVLVLFGKLSKNTQTVFTPHWKKPLLWGKFGGIVCILEEWHPFWTDVNL